MTTIAVSELQKDTTIDEWRDNVWSDCSEWCIKCANKNNRLLIDDKARTTKCLNCGHTQTFEEADWKSFQAQRYAIYQYMPGKYFFSDLTAEEIFKKYLREYNNFDWLSWTIHDYVLARMRNDKPIQEKLKEVAKQIVEKMDYKPSLWQTYFEKIDAKDPQIFCQVPQILYEYAEKHLQEETTKETYPDAMRSYLSKLSSLYSYSRWKGDRVACWIIKEAIKLCNVDKDTSDFYIEYFSYDPLTENFTEDILLERKREINIKDTFIQWMLNLADTYLDQSCALVAVQVAYEALGTKLGIHDLWPPKKALSFDMYTVKRVSQLIDDTEFFRFYDLATDLDAIDPKKACYYANLFIQKVKQMLPNITSIEQEQAKQNAYVT